MKFKEKKEPVEKIIFNLDLNYTKEDKNNIQNLIDTYFRLKKKYVNSKIELISGSLLWVYSRINFLFENDINWSQQEIAKKLDIKPKSISNNSSIIMDSLNIDYFDKRFSRKEIIHKDPRNNFYMNNKDSIAHIDQYGESFMDLDFDEEDLEKLDNLLEKDNPSITKNLKNIYGKEEEYEVILFAIEETILDEYFVNKNLKDKKIISYLNNFLNNLDKEISFFKSDFEKELYYNLTKALDEKKITKHELKLCLNYILWSIDNRSWLDYPQAYVKWLAYLFDIMDDDERKKYEIEIRKLCKDKGISNEEINAILTNDFSNLKIENNDFVKIQSEFFALDENEKKDFISDKFLDYPEIMERYYYQLIEKKEFKKVEELCKLLLKKYPYVPLIGLLLGSLYLEMGKKNLAIIEFEKGLKYLENLSSKNPEIISQIAQIKEILNEIREDNYLSKYF